MSSEPHPGSMARLKHLLNAGDRSLVGRSAAALSGSKSVLDVGCGRDSILQRLPQFAHTVGMDGHLPAIEDSRRLGIHDEYVHGDVTDLAFEAKSFDSVIAYDLIEHLTTDQGLALLAASERIARRSVVIFTPNGDVEQDEYDENPLQAHQSAWAPADFKRLGYTVYGMKGLRQLRGEQSTPRRPQAASRLALSLSQPLVERRPRLAYSLLAVKHV